ncbi:MAG: cytochrome c biogenesis CcdA family protein [Solirubrobacteraceae bacterium]
MDSSVFFGGSVIAAVLAGAVALFAPCCISVMLPGYLATAFQNRRTLVAMTFLFAAGVATIILPIAVGAHALQRIFTSQHTLLYAAMGVILVVLAGYVFLGGKLRLPMPGRRADGKAGPLSVYTLGIFSGATSSCCAPVLAGVLALSGAAGSFGKALGLGSAYVFGMVAPLFVISLLWERFDWRAMRLFCPRSITWGVGPVSRSISITTLLSALLLAAMGAALLVIGLAADSMPSARGWQAELSARLQHYAKVATDALSFIPGWAAALTLLLIVALLARRALRQVASSDDHEPPPPAIGNAGDSPVADHQPEYV